MRWARHVASTEEVINGNKILYKKPECKTSLERPQHPWKI
jgi:hypothetical protein